MFAERTFEAINQHVSAENNQQKAQILLAKWMGYQYNKYIPNIYQN